MRLSPDIPSRLARSVFAMLMALVWAGATQKAGAADPPPATSADLAQLSAAIGKLLKQSEAIERQIPRETFDFNAVVNQAGRSPGDLFKWVRQNTIWVPYHGVLRGGSGVLMDRVGNSLDRSLLLATLLQTAGQTVRLQHGQISEQKAKELLPGLRKAARPPVTTGEPADDQKEVEQIARDNGTDVATVRRTIAQNTLEFSRRAEDMARRVSEQTPVLASALAGAAKARAKSDESDIDSLRDHWWVQRQETGNWIDMDLLGGDGKAIVPADKFVPIDAVHNVIPLDASLWHEVVVRVVTEQLKDGKLKESTVLTQNMRPADVLGKRITLINYPLNWPTEQELNKSKDPEQGVRQALLKVHEWVPVLSVSESTRIASSVSDNGDVDPHPNLTGAPSKATVAGAQGALDAFGLGNDAPPKAVGAFTAQWIEFEIHQPGSAPRTIRREVFDLIGPAARAASKAPDVASLEASRLRRALAMTGESDLLIVGSQLSEPFSQHLGAVALREACQKAAAALEAGAKNDTAGVNQQMGAMNPAAAPLMVWGTARYNWSRAQERIYLDGPNVAAYHRRIVQDAQGKLVLRSTLDIVENEIGVRGEGDASAMRLQQGVVDTNAEALVMPTRGTGAAEAFNQSIGQGKQWQTITSASDPKLASLGISDDLRARVMRELQAGYVVVVPSATSRVNGMGVDCWWRINPGTGEALGMTEAGGSAVEDTFMIRLMVTSFVFTANMLSCTGVSKETGPNKALGCLICSALVAALFWFAYAGAAGRGGAATKWAAGPNGTGAGGVLGGVCAIVGTAMPSNW